MALTAVLSALPVSAASSDAGGDPPASVEPRWRPLIELTGGGDEALAVQRLRRINGIYRSVLTRARMHPQTRGFIDDLWASFADFDLRRFRELLPEREGPWRVLHVHGAPHDGGYRLGPDPDGVGLDPDGVPRRLGELHTRVRMKALRRDERESYLLDLRTRTAVGPVSWDAVTRAYAETLRNWLAARPEPDYEALVPYIRKARALSERLGPGDVAVLARLWAAYPRVGDVAARTGSVDDVLGGEVDREGVKHLHTVLALEPDRMESHYPDLADHLEDLGPLVRVEGSLHSGQGRLLSVVVDSRPLTLELEGYVRNGRLLPVRDGRIVAREKTGPVGSVRELHGSADVRLQLHGVRTRLQDVAIDIRYRRTADGALITGRLTRMPRITVDGRALGFLPTGAVDVVIPGNLEGLVTEFVRTAVEGNGGDGVVVQTRLADAAEGDTARLETRLTFEGLSSGLVRWGVGMVNRRAIPDGETSEDIDALLRDLQRAFEADLDRFAGISGRRDRH